MENPKTKIRRVVEKKHTKTSKIIQKQDRKTTINVSIKKSKYATGENDKKDIKIYYNKSILKKNKNVKCLNRREGKLATTWKTKIKMKTKTEATKIK